MEAKKQNRFLAVEEENFEEASNWENSIAFVATAVFLGVCGWWVADSYNMPNAMTVFAILLGPTLYVGWVSAKAKIKTVQDIEAEAIEAVEKAGEVQAQALLVAGKAADYDRLKSELQSLQEKERLSKADNDRLWQKIRSLEEQLTAEKAKATTDIEATKNSLIPLQKQLIDAQKRLSAIETAIRIEGEIGSLNGRSSKATGEEKELIERLKLEERSKMTEHLKYNHWLMTLKPSWGGVKI